MWRVRSILSLLLLVAIGIFAVQNLESVDVQFLVFSMKMPKIILILLIFLLGMVSGWGLVDMLKGAIRNVSSTSRAGEPK